MKSSRHGQDTSSLEVTNISQHGFWIWLDGVEHFLPFDRFPWFKQATIEQITDVQLLHDRHLHWPGLDVDLTVDMIEHPDRYPLVSK